MLKAIFLGALTALAVADNNDASNQGITSFRLPAGAISDFATRDDKHPFSGLQRRADCGLTQKTCGTGCISSLDKCCPNGRSCRMFETCTTTGCACTTAGCSSGTDGKTGCRAGEEQCGTGCMTQGAVCCDGRNFCPAGTICAGDQCKTSKGGDGSRLVNGKFVAALPVVLFAMAL